MTVLSLPLDGWVEPEDLARLLDDGPGFVLSDPAQGPGFVGLPAGPDDVVLLDDAQVLRGGRPVAGARGLGGLAQVLRAGLATSTAASSWLGWWGVLGYEAGARELAVPMQPADGPEAAFLLVDRGVVVDRSARRLTLLVAADAAGARGWLVRTAARVRAARSWSVPAPGGAARVRWRLDREAYLDRIEACRSAIVDGEAYLLCLTTTIDVELDRVRPWEVYRRLRGSVAAPHGGVLRVGDSWLLSGSPERFLQVDRDGRARTTPIKGTRRRDVDPALDRALAAQLAASEKERAENLMIVDLCRNDLSRVGVVGSVGVRGLFEVRTYPNVHQLVSTVEAALDVDAVGALLALFPAGSMTGAPKRAAMSILAGLEVGPRGSYSGVWGRLASDGSAELAVVIRSIALRPGRASVGTGGGITSDSHAPDEWDEVVLKAGPMLDALADPAREGQKFG